MAGAGLSATPAAPNRRLATIPVTVTDLVEKKFVRCMVILSIASEPTMIAAVQARLKIWLAKDRRC
ncbi:hypothetical protein AAFG13_33000 [Bradyrhizobium sp. B124]|uniref:hypothetical protein n=1 Tax=Bradyrhizobium sp. B124 TaxID=3140245 RepID=UPI003183CC56